MPAEINAWVVTRPDERKPIGFATPGQNLARKRVWCNFTIVGSCGIHESHE